MRAPEADHFRRVLGAFPTGVVIVTGAASDGPHGVTCQSFTSVSLAPPLVAFCPSRASVTWGRLREGRCFAVNVLAEDQSDLVHVFASKDADRFARVTHHASPHVGAPLLEGAHAWIECRLHAEHEAGDHTIVVGEVLSMEIDEVRRPLVYWRSSPLRLA